VRQTDFVMQVVLTAKGELLIPADLLDRYGLSAGDTVVLELRAGELVVRPADAPVHRARLVEGPKGTMLLEAPEGAPPMTTETVRRMLEDFP
jgi:AbrB family looped-hinge helix DNA binding protein